MSMQLSYHENWPAAEERMTAFWRGESLGRPAMYLTAPRTEHTPLPVPESLEQKYFDPDFIYRYHAARLGNLHFFAEALPCATQGLMAGWLPAYGAELQLMPDTLWFETIVHDWDNAPDWDEWDNPQFRRLCDIIAALAEKAEGQFMVGMPPLLPPNDLLSVLRHTNDFLMDLVLRPEKITGALQRMTQSYLKMLETLSAIIHRHFTGMHHHYPVWAPQTCTVQSDVSCTLSPAMFEEFVVPELELITARFGPAIYHLDGPDAIGHLPRICAIPGIRMIQWVPGAGQPGGFEHWLHVFKTAQKHDCCIYLPVAVEQIEAAIREFRPERTFMLCAAADADEAQSILENAQKWTEKYWK